MTTDISKVLVKGTLLLYTGIEASKEIALPASLTPFPRSRSGIVLLSLDEARSGD